MAAMRNRGSFWASWKNPMASSQTADVQQLAAVLELHLQVGGVILDALPEMIERNRVELCIDRRQLVPKVFVVGILLNGRLQSPPHQPQSLDSQLPLMLAEVKSLYFLYASERT